MRMKLVKAIEGKPGLRVIGQASDLPATYTAAEPWSLTWFWWPVSWRSCRNSA